MNAPQVKAVTPEEAQAWAKEAAMRLRKLVRPRLRTMFLGFLTELQLHLLTGILSTRSDDDERKRQNLLRSLKQQIVSWTDGFISCVELRFLEDSVQARGTEISFRQSGSATAELMSLAKALLHAETQFFKIMTEIDARLNRIRLFVPLPITARALAPTGLHNALLQTADLMKWPDYGREALMVCFDRHFIRQLDGLYARLLTGLKDIEREASTLRVIAPPKTEQEQADAAKPRPKEPWMHPPRDMREVDTDTVAMLRELALKMDGEGYTDGLLAADLLSMVEQQHLSGLGEDKTNHSLQRARLAGHFFNEIKTDPLISKNAQSRHEALRLPLLKSAIADASVFTDEAHPISNLIDDLLTKTAAHRLMGNQSQEEKIANSVHQTLSLFDLAPEFVRESMENATPLDDADINRFYEIQRNQAARRREFVVGEAKRIVAEEIERSTFGCDLPAPAEKFLRKAWCVVLTQRLLRHGAFHKAWLNGIEKADKLIEMLNGRDPKAKPPEEWRLLTATMGKELLESGLPKDQLSKVLSMLQAAWTTLPDTD